MRESAKLEISKTKTEASKEIEVHEELSKRQQ
jgi:hypothetical protein